MTKDELLAYVASIPGDTPIYVWDTSWIALVGTVYQDPEVNGIVLVPQRGMRDGKD